MFIDTKLYERNQEHDSVSGMLESLLKSARGPYSGGKIRTLTYITYASLIIWILAEIIYFFFAPNVQFILDYALCMCMYLYAVLIITTNVLQKERMNRMELMMKENFWNLNCCGPVFYSNFLKIAPSYRILTWFQDILGYFNGIFLLPFNTDRLDILFFLMFLKSINVSVYKFYRYIYFFTELWACRVAISYPNLYLYYMVHLNFQYKLLTHHMQNIEINSEKYQSDEQYMKSIRRRMIFCIRHYQKLKDFRRELYELIFYPFFFIMWSGLGISMFMAYLLLVIGQRTNILPLALMWTTLAECAIYFSIVGQVYSDMADDFINVLNSCKWYQWSISNRKTYSLFLANAQKNKTLTGGGYGPMDVTFAIWIFRKTISALTFFKAVHRINEA